ncbi:LysR substrate-binding domain-containing protein [Pseudomonas helleri]|jgi:DNA-binding transcriptional LysR family regulator|uniref:LysR family transcriptional regulator n=1 Tax=Pseudomonas helleri TaxID=1608996 RepID=A0A6A7Z104_9PSED|nr:LysR substrate-binding domain-containing protein [Pseudomonas helleri]KMN20854.1 LysR family transcriptional regulator [Pseudomonas helleri]MQT34619.1 LysR family transcriptional regulator [Pseudomonas helleri]MQT75915.1 LysR family transcriptional regulator [Pseudomonas helleri]MQT93218.1 LysR family transcriptional regulator [Pseudomonas helleri]MQU22693.1 LysR family transcriptional regulator [Pseudomonas helleri]
MQDLNDLYYFAKVVEAGGFAAAGRLLGIPKSRLSRRVAELEERLGARLLQRTTRQLKLTAVGERYLSHCQAMLLQAEMADEAVASMSSEPRGRLRVSCPVGLAHQFMPEVVSSFLRAYPHVQLEVSLLNRRVDLITEGIDVAMRVRELGDEDPLLVTRRLRKAVTVMVASPAFAEQWAIKTPDDLKNAPVLGALEADRMVHLRMLDEHGKASDMVLEARLGIDDFNVRKACTLQGLGFTVLPLMYCEHELETGELVQLLPQWSLPGGWLQAVYPHRRGVMPAVRAWIEHLADTFERCGEKTL